MAHFHTGGYQLLPACLDSGLRKLSIHLTQPRHILVVIAFVIFVLLGDVHNGELQYIDKGLFLKK